MPVTLDGEKYTLIEMTGKQRDAFLDDIGGRMKFIAGKSAGMKNYDGLQAFLVALCLIDKKGDNVKKEVIQSYPSSVQTKLFKAAQELNGLDDESAEQVKND